MRLLLLITIISLGLFSCSDNELRSEELTTKSKESFIKGNFELALNQADSAIILNDENYYAYNNRGAAKDKLQYPFKDVEADILKSLELNPDGHVALTSLMNLYFNNKEYDKVLLYAEKYQRLYSVDSSRLNNIIGESYRVIKNHDKSLYFLNRAVQLKPDSWGANLNLGELYMDKNDYKKALIYLGKAKRLNPDYAPTYNELGISHYVVGELDSALYYVDVALQLKRDTIFMINKGVYLIKLDSIKSGCTLFAEVERMGRTIEKIYGIDSEAAKLKIKHCQL